MNNKVLQKPQKKKKKKKNLDNRHLGAGLPVWYQNFIELYLGHISIKFNKSFIVGF